MKAYKQYGLACIVLGVLAQSSQALVEPTLLTVPAGTYTQGDEFLVGTLTEQPTRQTTFDSSYQMAETEITVAEYVAMLNYAMDPNDDGDTADSLLIFDAVNPDSVQTATVTGNRPRVMFYISDPLCQIVWDGTAFGIKDIAGHPDGDVDTRANHPVAAITWHGAMYYCWVLNDQLGITDQPISFVTAFWYVDPSKAGYRLPTEAEWEWAARGAWNEAKYSWWKNGQSATQTEPDGTQSRLTSMDDVITWAAPPHTRPVKSYAGKMSGSKEDAYVDQVEVVAQ
jgi:formylglycine-generating enzyme required for sulfatase activity